MSLQVKYSPVLALAKGLNVQGLDVKEDAGKLKLSGTVITQYEKNIIWVVIYVDRIHISNTLSSNLIFLL